MVAELYELKDFHLFHELKHFPFCEVRIYYYTFFLEKTQTYG